MSKCGIDLAKQDDCRELDELEMKSVRGSDPREDSALTTISLTDFDVGHDFAPVSYTHLTLPTNREV